MRKILQVPFKMKILQITAFTVLVTMLTLFTNTAKSQGYDLALINGISTDFSTHYCPGDEVRYNTVLYNTGDVEACNVQITAYIPAGMSASSNPLNSIWTINGSVATANITSCIPPGGVYPNSTSDPLSAFLILELDNPPSSTITFYSEISQDDGDDIDSTPDSDPNNDALVEGVIFSSNDEDDHDVTTIVVREDCVETGCTDPCAPNYDSTATQDDGSCAAYSTDCNTDICAGDVADWNPNTCGCQVTTTQVIGCTDATANNYNPAANCNSPNTCTYTPVGNYDLALITGVSSTYGTTYCPGDEVRFNTVIYNTGEVEACNVEVTAYIPAGMSVSSNPLNSIWTVTGSTATATISNCIPPGGTYPNEGSDPLSTFLILEITGATGTMINFYAEISMDDGDDIDSTPDNDPNNDAGAVPNTSTDNSIYNPDDEDDHDVASITIGNCNIGCTDPCADNYNPEATTDDGSCLPYSTTCNTDICAADIAVWNPNTCSCQVTTTQVLGCTDPLADNYNPSANCDDGSCMTAPDGDYDLALITGISSTYGTTYCPGDEVRFNTVIYNTGEVEACNVEITAYIPAGMSVSSNPLNSIWTVNGSTATATISNCIPPGGTYPNESTDPLSTFLILEITGAPGTMINFYAEISQDDGDDIDSTPDNDPNNDAGAIPNTATDNSIFNPADEDDHDVATIIICDEAIYDLALITTLAPGYSSTVNTGDEVGFTTTVYNQGEEQACNVEVTAYIPIGMSLSNNPLNSIWTVNGTQATTTINTCIQPGGAESVNIYLTLDSTASGSAINFYAEISQDDGNDIDSTSDNSNNNDTGAVPNSGTDDTINGEMGDEDDHDVAQITVGTPVNYDLALITGISSSFEPVYCVGDEVRFNTAIYNTGEVEACNVQISAYIPDGMSVSDNPLNSIWTVSGNIATTYITSCIPAGGVYPNADSDPLSTFLILELNNAPNTMINFYSEISEDDGDDRDSTADNNPNNDAGAIPNSNTDNTIYNQGGDEDDHDVAAIIVDSDCGGLRLGNSLNINKLSIENIYPTIANSTINVVIAAESKADTRIQIVDLKGSIVSDKTFEAKENINAYELNVDMLSNGIYLLNVIKGNEKVSQKFIVE